MSNYEFNPLGRIWVVWRSTVRLTPVFKSNQIITCYVLFQGRESEFFISFVYALNSVEGRKGLWEDLCNHHDSPVLRNKPWIIMGDFNEIINGEEHSVFGDSPSIPVEMRDF